MFTFVDIFYQLNFTNTLKRILSMQKLRSYIESFATISDQDWLLFSSFLIKREMPKKHVFLQFGEIESYISFIERGKVRLFIPHIDVEKERTFGFSFEGEFVSAYDSFLTQTPSLYQLQTLENTILWSINYNNLQNVYQNTQVGNTIGRFVSEHLFMIKSKREQSLLNETPEQRYLKLFNERPNVIKEIPLKYIASYIGVTPQALSCIRRNIF